MVKPEEKQPTSKRSKSRIPHFKTIEEAVQFWDTHSLAEFEDELEEVTDVRFVVTRGGPQRTLSIRLSENDLAEIRR